MRENGFKMRTPISEGAKVDVPYSTRPLGIILTEKYLDTVSKGGNEILEEFGSEKA
jgi:hypothetical protein